MTLRFTVPGLICGINQAYTRVRRGTLNGTVLTNRGRVFKERVRQYAFIARQTQPWPNPANVTSIALVVLAAYNCPHDAQAPDKLAVDSMQGVVYENDKVVEWILSGRPKDSGEQRLEVKVYLDEIPELLKEIFEP